MKIKHVLIVGKLCTFCMVQLRKAMFWVYIQPKLPAKKHPYMTNQSKIQI